MDKIRQKQFVMLDMLVEIDKLCKKYGLIYYLAYGTALGAVRHKGFIPWDSDVDIIVEMTHYQEFCNVIEKEINKKYFLESIKTNKAYEELFARVVPRGELHQIIHIDVFPIVGVPKAKLAQKLFSKIAYVTYRSFFVKKVDVNVNYKNNPRKKRLVLFCKLLLGLVPSGLFVWIFKKLSVAFPIKNENVIYNFCGSYGYRELMPKSYLGKPVKMLFEKYEFPVPEKWHEYLTHLYGDYMIPKKENYV